MLFNGEVVIITGGAQGIGKAIAYGFASEGAIPVLFDINTKKGEETVLEFQEKGYQSQFINCDVSNVDSIDYAVNKVADKYGSIDVLVNNAGIVHSTPLEDITEEEWDKIMAVNLKSVFFMSQKVIAHMKKKNSGKIVNISSLAGRMGGYANGLGYSATKAAIIGLTYGMARRVAQYNINVNAIAPGTTETDILRAFTEEKIRELRESIPLRRLGTPKDIANAAVFLGSHKASFITGAVLDVNGGMFTG